MHEGCLDITESHNTLAWTREENALLLFWLAWRTIIRLLKKTAKYAPRRTEPATRARGVRANNVW